MSDKNEDQEENSNKPKAINEPSDGSVLDQKALDSIQIDKEYFKEYDKYFSEKREKFHKIAQTATREELIEAMDDLFKPYLEPSSEPLTVKGEDRSRGGVEVPICDNEKLIPVKILNHVFFFKKEVDESYQEKKLDETTENRVKKALSLIKKMTSELEEKINLIEKSYTDLEKRL